MEDATLSELEALVRKLTRKAAEASMELHDLTEELPGAYLRIPDVARRTLAIHEELAKAKEVLSRKKDNPEGFR